MENIIQHTVAYHLTEGQKILQELKNIGANLNDPLYYPQLNFIVKGNSYEEARENLETLLQDTTKQFPLEKLIPNALNFYFRGQGNSGPYILQYKANEPIDRIVTQEAISHIITMAEKHHMIFDGIEVYTQS